MLANRTLHAIIPCSFRKPSGGWEMKINKLLVCALPVIAALLGVGSGLMAADSSACKGLPSHADLQKALKSARAQANGGFNLDMWGTIVNRDGVVCAVAFTGNSRGDQ